MEPSRRAEIRREVTYRANLAAANWKARKLNEILPNLQEQFEQALLEGEVLELGPGDWVEDALESDGVA